MIARWLRNWRERRRVAGWECWRGAIPEELIELGIQTGQPVPSRVWLA